MAYRVKTHWAFTLWSCEYNHRCRTQVIAVIGNVLYLSEATIFILYAMGLYDVRLVLDAAAVY
jgi:hypothetical protein